MQLTVFVRVARLRSAMVVVSMLVIALVEAAAAAASTLSVCATGCAYADFQAALDAAQPGDTVLLRAGETFVGNFTLPAKSGGGSPILVRSDAPDSALPGDGVRLVPAGYPGATAAPGALARLRGVGGGWKTTPVLQSAPGAGSYRLQFLDVDGLAQEGWGTLIELGNNSSAQTTLDVVPYGIVLDRVFVHGHPTKGQKRCIALNGRGLDVINSYVSGCAAVEIDAQAIAGFNGPGPFRILNNYLEASTENILFGGADPRIAGLVPSDIEIRRNLFTKPVAWRDPILSPPSAPAVTSIGGGGLLGAGTHYFAVVAVLSSAGDEALSAASVETAVSVRSDGSAVTLTWKAVAGADFYRIYRGTSPGAEDRYIATSGAVTAMTYTGSGETAAALPTEGKRWNVKNLLELKNAQRVIIDGNTFEYSWAASQKGYAILLTPRNQEGTAPWSVVRDISLTSNIIRHAAGAIDILGSDYEYPSQRTTNISIRNNLVYDISSTWGQEHFLLITSAPLNVTVDHNTVYQERMIILVDNGASSGFIFTNNVAPHNEYGIDGSGASFGNTAIAAYFPDSIIRRNALGGASASLYPADNLFPDMTTFNAQFVNVAAADYRLVSDSIFKAAGTDGKDLGIDFGALANAMTGQPPDSSGGTGSLPFGGTPLTMPGILQAEDFNNGGTNVGYFDNTSGNSGGQYRSTDVDIESTADAGGGYDVAWAFAGEWLKYTVNVGASGTYDLEVRVASAGSGGTFHLEVDGRDVTGAMAVPNTGGWQAWTTVRKTGIAFAAGPQVWTLVMDTNGATTAVGNFNYLRLASRTASAPFGGQAVSLPGTLQAENFDEGGAGAAYADATSGNAGGQYRATDVDIEQTSDAGGGYDVGWVSAGEWLAYTVNVAAAGTYDLDVRVASNGVGGTFHIEVNGVDKTGPMTVPNTGGWQAWTTIRKSGVNLDAGLQVWRIVMDSDGPTTAVGNFDFLQLVPQVSSSPYGGTPVALPGTIQVENFDDGGPTCAYLDTTAGNAGGQYRVSDDVDIERTSDGGGGYNVGWAVAGEWLNYTVNVTAAGTYDIDVRVASAGAGGIFHIEANGTDITGPLTVPNTGGWQAWATIRKAGVALAAGTQVWRLVMDTNGSTGTVGNFNYISVAGPR